MNPGLSSTKGIPRLIVVALLCVAAIAFSVSIPGQADALEITRWTAKSNKEGSNDVLGSVPTRVTLQAQTSSDESLKQLVVDLPQDSQFSVDDVKVTVMKGLDRVDTISEVSTDGDTGVTIDFPTPTPAGDMIMVEFNECTLSGDGGSFNVAGSYTTSDGATHDLPLASTEIVVVGVSLVYQWASWMQEQPWYKAWDSIKFCHVFLDPATAIKAIPAVFEGWSTALLLVVISFPLAIPLGLCWAFMRMSKSRIPRGIGSLYINVVRGTPVFLQIYIAFFGLPLLGVNLTNDVVAIIVLTMNSSAYLAEIFRAGIQSIDKGQFEAARSLGMSGVQTMLNVIIPQTFRRVIPTMTSELILMYKDTSLLAAVGVLEIMFNAKVMAATSGTMTAYIVAAGFYLVVTLPLTKLINVLETRMSDRESGIGKKSKKQRKADAELEADTVLA